MTTAADLAALLGWLLVSVLAVLAFAVVSNRRLARELAHARRVRDRRQAAEARRSTALARAVTARDWSAVDRALGLCLDDSNVIPLSSRRGRS